MEKLTKRQEDLLKIIIENYIETSIPVGSKQITEDLDVSSATIRNEMSELENLGYLVQPHISAGRIPTEEAYRFYVNNFLENSKLSSSDEDLLANIEELDSRDLIKKMAKKLAEMLNLAVVVAFTSNDSYYTGISGLFTQSEFKKDFVYLSDFTALLDHLDEKTSAIFNKIDGQTSVFIGADNPFSEACSSVITKIELENILIVIIGPVRMDYIRAVNCLNFVKNKLISIGKLN